MEEKTSLFIFFPLTRINYLNYLVPMPAVQPSVPTFHAGLYAVIEGSSKLSGPTMHPCGQLNRPPPNLRRTISEAPYQASLSTSRPLSEVFKVMHRTSRYSIKLSCTFLRSRTL